MKSLLVFLPERFTKESPGCMYGTIEHYPEDDVMKFFILGLTESSQSISRTGNDLLLLGYFYGTEKKCEYWERKLQNWVEIYLTVENGIVNYFLRNVHINQKIIPSTFHTVVILYSESSLLKAELIVDKVSDHFTELRLILKKEFLRKKREELKTVAFTRVKETLFIHMVLVFLYPVFWLYKVTDKILPVLKYSSLGIHSHSWLKNTKWMLSTLYQRKKFTLKTINHCIAMLIDAILGVLLLRFLLHFLGDASPSGVLLDNAEKVVESLKGLINWLMGSPAGLKLNRSFNAMLGKFFLYHIHLWWTFLIVLKPLMELAFEILLLFGRLGVTFQISIMADLLALVSFHTYCIYVYAARLFNIQIQGLIALFRLFLGKKQNPLRKRVDSCRYQPDQLFVGTLLFTILLFLMPTTWIYYFVFTSFRLIMIGLGGILTRINFYLQIMPVYLFFRWLFCFADVCGTVGIKLQERNTEGPITLKTVTAVTSWNETWRRCIPDTVKSYPAIEWNKIVKNAFSGQLLYPL